MKSSRSRKIGRSVSWDDAAGGFSAYEVLVDPEPFETAMQPFRPARIGMAIRDESQIFERYGLGQGETYRAELLNYGEGTSSLQLMAGQPTEWLRGQRRRTVAWVPMADAQRRVDYEDDGGRLDLKDVIRRHCEQKQKERRDLEGC